VPINEKPLDYFLRMLIEGQLNFSDLLGIYVSYLEKGERENRELVVEAAFLVTMLDNPKFNRGSEKDLKKRVQSFIKNSQVFPQESL